MKTIPFGRTAAKVSEMCLGTMTFGNQCLEKDVGAVVARALELGVNFLDTAPMYSDGLAEEILGRVLKGKRDRVFLVSKVNSVEPKDILQGIDASLRRLQTDRLDLFLLHWPKEGMRPDLVMEVLHATVKAGKTRFIGCCNHPAWLFERSNAIAGQKGWTPYVAHQVPYNLVERGIEVEVLPSAASSGTPIMVYRALLAGALSGKYLTGGTGRGASDERIPKWTLDYAPGIRRLVALAAEKGCTPSQLAIAWVRSRHPLVFPIIGVSRLPQLEEAAGAFGVSLSPQEAEVLAAAFDAEVWEESGGAYKGHRRNPRLVA